MIQNVNFMGREECLTKPAKKVIDKTHEYVGSGTYFENAATKVFDTNKKVAEEQAVQINEAIKAKYAPFTIENKAEQIEKDLGNEWATAHGLPIIK